MEPWQPICAKRPLRLPPIILWRPHEVMWVKCSAEGHVNSLEWSGIWTSNPSVIGEQTLTLFPVKDMVMKLKQNGCTLVFEFGQPPVSAWFLYLDREKWHSGLGDCVSTPWNLWAFSLTASTKPVRQFGFWDFKCLRSCFNSILEVSHLISFHQIRIRPDQTSVF